MLESAKRWARLLKRDVVALYLAVRSPLTPWIARVAAACVAAYALSPVDLIPDFVPVLGYLDDLLIVPLGIWLAIRMTPAELMARFRAEAAEITARPRSMPGLAFIMAVWLAGVALAGWWWLGESIQARHPALLQCPTPLSPYSLTPISFSRA